MMKLFTALMLFCATAAATPFPDGNAASGQKLFQQYNCNRCHSAMMGGDGNAIFTRANRKVHNETELIEQILVCSGNVGAQLTTQQQHHLGAYLNQYYKLK
jgi:mono/diheme cytochrome c family protein